MAVEASGPDPEPAAASAPVPGPVPGQAPHAVPQPPPGQVRTPAGPCYQDPAQYRYPVAAHPVRPVPRPFRAGPHPLALISMLTVISLVALGAVNGVVGLVQPWLGSRAPYEAAVLDLVQASAASYRVDGLDMVVTADGDATGTLTVDDATYEVLRVDGTTYVELPATIWGPSSGFETGTLDDRWFEVDDEITAAFGVDVTAVPADLDALTGDLMWVDSTSLLDVAADGADLVG